MSVISRMLQDLESRGAALPIAKQAPAPQVARTDLSWLRTFILSGGLMAAVVAMYSVKMPAWVLGPDAATVSGAKGAGHRRAPSDNPGNPDKLVSVEPNWKLDWALSLGLIKAKDPILVDEPVQLSLSPNHDLAESPEQTPVRPEGEPPLVDAHATGPLIIDPPAAGRVQSTGHQAVEAYRRALDQMEQGRDAVALDTLVQALKWDAQHLPARRVAIALALEQKQMDLAAALLDEGLKMEPRDSELLYLHARHLAVAGADDLALTALQQIDRPTGEALGLKAGLLAKTGRYAPAVAAYEQALKTRPDNATWWLGLGVACQAQGQADMAKQAFVRARRLGQLSPDVQAWLDQQI